MHLTPGQNTIGNLNGVGDIRNNLEDVGARASYFFMLNPMGLVSRRPMLSLTRSTSMSVLSIPDENSLFLFLFTKWTSDICHSPCLTTFENNASYQWSRNPSLKYGIVQCRLPKRNSARLTKWNLFKGATSSILDSESKRGCALWCRYKAATWGHCSGFGNFR